MDPSLISLWWLVTQHVGLKLNIHIMSEGEFSAKSKHSTGSVNGKQLDVVSVGFADKISIMVYSRDGRLGKLFSVSLSALSAANAEVPKLPGQDENYLLPLPNINPVALMGSDANDVQGRLYASTISSLVARQSPQERRNLVIGVAYDLGPREDEEIEKHHRQELLEVVKLVQEARVW